MGMLSLNKPGASFFLVLSIRQDKGLKGGFTGLSPVPQHRAGTGASSLCRALPVFAGRCFAD